jgi:histidine ammonia-lyase
LWNAGLIPAIPKKGTVGASGDLAPLAHLALPLLGQGQVLHGGELISGSEALQRLGCEPLQLKAKEGLALTNGVQYINAYAVDALTTLGDLVAAGEVIAALSLQAYSASETFYQSLYHSTSRHLERRRVAHNLQRLVEGSNHFRLPSCNHSKQDPYSFRCIPQVHGAIRQAFDFGYRVVEDEVNGVSDNPLFFPQEDRVLFGGNLHGESTAMALDFMAIAASELASISERRTYLLLSGTRGLPDFLVREPGVNSGFMISQYTSAALVNQNKVLASPASVDTISTCQLQEDHVSMGGTSAYKLEEILDNCEYVLGIELLNAVQASELNEGLELSPVTDRIRQEFRKVVEPLQIDRVMSGDIERARDFIRQHCRQWRQWLDTADTSVEGK